MSEQAAEPKQATKRRKGMSRSAFGKVWIKGVKADKTLDQIIEDLGLDPTCPKDKGYVRQKSTQLRKYVAKHSPKDEDGKPLKSLPKLTNTLTGRKTVDLSFLDDTDEAGDAPAS